MSVDDHHFGVPGFSTSAIRDASKAAREKNCKNKKVIYVSLNVLSSLYS